VVERGGLENRCPFTGTQGSNPCLSAIYHKKIILLHYLICVSNNSPPHWPPQILKQTHCSPTNVPSAQYILISCFFGLISFSGLESRALKLRIQSPLDQITASALFSNLASIFKCNMGQSKLTPQTLIDNDFLTLVYCSQGNKLTIWHSLNMHFNGRTTV
jgi:hypothetical protein